MKLFGKKRKNGVKKPKTNKKRHSFKRKKLYKTPSDVKLFYQMPFILVLAVIGLCTGFFWIRHNAKAYQAQVMASSMKYGEELPLWGGQSKGVLTLGHSRLSKDGKTYAIEIKYNDDAHQGLSSFGNRYRLRLVDTKSNRMSGLKMSYGIFGTDGSGVLTLHSAKGFKDAAFLVMIIDNGQLVTSDDLQNQQLDDSDIDNSITAQLSDASDSSSDSASQEKERKTKLPPLYYVRLNAYNATRNYRNWSNDSEMIDDLFVKDNLADLRKKMSKTLQKVNKAKKTLTEMNNRLSENSQDQVAKQGRDDIKTTLSSLKQDYTSEKKQYAKLKNSTISPTILDPQQTKYHTYTVDDLSTIR